MNRACGCPTQIPGWHNEDVNLAGYRIYVNPLTTPMHMPLSFDLQKNKQNQELKDLELTELWPGLCLLSTGAWRGELWRFVEQESISRNFRIIPNPYWVRVSLHPGGIGTVKKTIGEMQHLLLEHKKMPKKLFLAHLTCPHCVQEQGGEKILVFRHWQAK